MNARHEFSWHAIDRAHERAEEAQDAIEMHERVRAAIAKVTGGAA